jgi:hypothetical protein
MKKSKPIIAYNSKKSKPIIIQKMKKSNPIMFYLNQNPLRTLRHSKGSRVYILK